MSAGAAGPAAPRNRLWVALATVCLISSWYYGLVVAPIGLASADRGILQDLYGVWNGSRVMLVHRISPYSVEVTAQNQAAIYGRTVAGHVEQQFAYPAFAAFPLAPLALLPFRAAQFVAFLAFSILTAISVMWWRGPQTNALLPILLTLSTYPVVVALQLRQPTLLFAALIAASTAQIRSRPVIAGLLLALGTAKPQLALSVCVPLLFWAVASWRERRAFVLSFGISELVLVVAATVLVPHWFSQWLTVLHSYSRYGGQPLLVTFFGAPGGTIISVLVAAAALVICWRWREDVLFSVSFSVAALQLIAPFQTYNEIMLLAPICWIGSNIVKIGAFGWIHRILVAGVWLVLAEGFVVVAGLGVVGAFVPLVAAQFWKVPVLFAFFLPAIVFATLLAYVIAATRLDSPVSRENHVPSRTLVSLLTSYHAYWYDAVLLPPAFFLAGSYLRGRKLGAVEVALAFVVYAVFLLPAVSASFNEMVAGMFVGMLLLAGLQFAELLDLSHSGSVFPLNHWSRITHNLV